jgi:dihydropteroate synthase
MQTPQKIQLMGILNITPDSFSDGGEYVNLNKAIKRAKQMREEGADIIDIGGESTRPGSDLVSEEEELQRVIPVIQAIKKTLPTITLSIDTWKSTVAEAALTEGCVIVNSLGGFTFDENLAAIVAKHKATIITYHIRGKPKTMQQSISDTTDIIKDLAAFFTQQIALGKHYHISKEQFILDPGIGFGKTVKQNIELLQRLNELRLFGLPLAIGVSRKSHLGMILKEKLGLETKPTERLAASLAETAIALQNGATIIRTHDVVETKQFVTMFEMLNN